MEHYNQFAIINFMYKDPDNKKAREEIIGVWIAEASHESRFQHLFECWQKFCENNKIVTDENGEYDEDDEDEFISKFMNELFDNPLNSDFNFQSATYYNLVSR